MPTLPGEKIDVEQTKIYKRQKLAQFKMKITLVNQDIKNVIGIKTPGDAFLVQEKASPWENLKIDVAAAGNFFVEFWSISILNYKGQTIIVGESPLPINLIFG